MGYLNAFVMKQQETQRSHILKEQYIAGIK